LQQKSNGKRRKIQFGNFLALRLNHAQVSVFVSREKGNGISGVSAMKGLHKMVKAAKDHFQRNAIERQGHFIGDVIA